MAEDKVFNNNGGVIGGKLTVLKTVVDCSDGLATGDYATKIKVPANSCVLYGFLGNVENDLAGTGATLQIKVGSTAVFTNAVALASAKGTLTVEADTTVTTAESDVKLTIGTAALTAGTVTVGVVILTA